MFGTLSPSGKRRFVDENAVSTPSVASDSFVDGLASARKRPRKYVKTREVTQEDLDRAREAYALRDPAEARDQAQVEAQAKAKEERQRQAQTTAAITQANEAIKNAGFPTTWSYIHALLNASDAHQSSTVTKMLERHGEELLAAIDERAPQATDSYLAKKLGKIIARESAAFATRVRPASGTPVSDVLRAFSIEGYLRDAEQLAPELTEILREAANCPKDGHVGRKDRDLVVVAALSMLTHARHERSSEFQTTMCIYLLACGVSRTQFDVLNHAGLTLSYSQALNKLKALSNERLQETVKLAHRQAFLIIWDNLNIAFRVGEQRLDSKDHFDSGTTATLIPLWDTERGALPLDLKPLRTTRLPHLDFSADDLRPSASQVREMEELFVWHIADMLYEQYPSLRARFREQIPPTPSVNTIPLHKTEQYPLPAMHLDESSLEGTIDVLNMILGKNLEMTADDIQAHGLVLCAGDQLSISLLDKVSASRRDDTDLVENIGKYTVGQLGLFHVKMAAARMTANNFWGSQVDLWSLCRINTLLRRKPISAGWSAKSLPPFRPVWELILTMALPANILDAFRIHSGSTCDTFAEWVESIPSPSVVIEIARKVLAEHCSARRVASIRRKSPVQQDPTFENISLFNREGLLLRVLKFAVRRGDVGAVVNVLAYWMLLFRGTGKMPKYADALFHTLISLKRMDPKLRHTFLMNWLANLSGKMDGFKEMDLLQEHQNFWAKIIYNARGSNRSWAWLSMVSVAIFVLRDVMRSVQEQFKIPYNSQSHTSPESANELLTLCRYLEEHKIQTYSPARQVHGSTPIPLPDRYELGAQYADTTGAFKTFRPRNLKVVNHGVAEGPSMSRLTVNEPDNTVSDVDLDMDGEPEVMEDDLAADDHEFFEYVGTLSDIVHELARCSNP